jgi:hypothetical protein
MIKYFIQYKKEKPSPESEGWMQLAAKGFASNNIPFGIPHYLCGNEQVCPLR